MAKVKINTGGKILIALLGLGLIGFAVWKFVIPKKGKEKGKNVEFAKADSPDKKGKSGSAAKGDSTAGLGRPVKVAIVTWGGYAGGIMANNGFSPNKDSTFWNEYDVEVEFKVLNDFSARTAALKSGGDSGGVDIAWITVDSHALQYPSIKSIDPKIFMQYDWSRGGDAIAVSKEIKDVTDLKNKRIAVAEATPSHYFALYVLSQADLKTDDVNWVFTDSAVQAANFFRQGKVDAAVSWSPDVYMAADDRKGGHILTSSKEATNLIADVFVVRGDFLKEHRDVVARFALGWFDGVNQVHNDPDKAAKLLAEGFEGVNEKAAKSMLGNVKLPTYAENLAFFEITGDQLRGYNDIYNEASRLWAKLGKISGRVQGNETVDTSILKGIRKEAEKRWGKVETEKQTKEFSFDFESSEEKEKAKGSEAILTKRLRVYFPTGSAKLTENAKAVLDQAAELAGTFGKARMRVVGNTDNVGNRSNNIALSKRRAKSVVDYMVEDHGFPRDKFIVIGNGPDNPIAPNDTKDGRQKNRRTDFEIIK